MLDNCFLLSKGNTNMVVELGKRRARCATDPNAEFPGLLRSPQEQRIELGHDGALVTRRPSIPQRAWLTHSGRRDIRGFTVRSDASYGAIVQEDGVPVLNLFRGLAEEARPRSKWSRRIEKAIDLFEAHVLDVIADGREDVALYIVRWLAWTVAHPTERPEVALMLHGVQGSGKGAFVHPFLKLFGAHGVSFTSDRPFGRFNYLLLGRLFVFADEAVFLLDGKNADAMKGLITEEYIEIEEKNLPTIKAKNHAAYVLATNRRDPIRLEARDRRISVDRGQRSTGSGPPLFQAPVQGAQHAWLPWCVAWAA